MAEIIAGFPAPLPFGIDFVTYSNEDIGFTSAFAAGSDVFQFPLPYPSSMNLWRESMILFALETIYHGTMRVAASLTSFQGMAQHLSMLGDDFGVDWGGVLVDAEDETFKSQFAGPDWVGQRSANLLTTANTQTVRLEGDGTQNIKYYPPEPLDLVTPLYVNWTNQSALITLATADSALDDDANLTELMAVRAWFIKRDYTTAEKAFLNRLPTRFQQLDS